MESKNYNLWMRVGLGDPKGGSNWVKEVMNMDPKSNPVAYTKDKAMEEQHSRARIAQQNNTFMEYRAIPTGRTPDNWYE